MAGAMRKMAVYLGLVEDDGYDGPGFDPDDEFEPEPEPERDRRRHQPRAPGGAGTGRTGTSGTAPRTSGNRCPAPGGKRTTRANRPRGIHHT